jgi:hypothetical protein
MSYFPTPKCILKEDPPGEMKSAIKVANGSNGSWI